MHLGWKQLYRPASRLALLCAVSVTLGNGFLSKAIAQSSDPWNQWLCMAGASPPPTEVEDFQTVDTPSEGLGYPLAERASISSEFGARIHPVSGLKDFHQGIDLAAPSGTEVTASADGYVMHAGRLGNLGNAVVIEHPGNQRTRYGHMLRLAVRKHERVQRGQIIGYVGSTGRSTGPHLHFEHWKLNTHRKWVAVDPRSMLALQARGDREAPATSQSTGGIGGIGEQRNSCS